MDSRSESAQSTPSSFEEYKSTLDVTIQPGVRGFIETLNGLMSPDEQITARDIAKNINPQPELTEGSIEQAVQYARGMSTSNLKFYTIAVFAQRAVDVATASGTKSEEQRDIEAGAMLDRLSYLLANENPEG